MRFCHGANVAEHVSHVNEGSGERDNGNVTFRGRVRKSLMRGGETSRKIDEYKTRYSCQALRWSALGACAISF